MVQTGAALLYQDKIKQKKKRKGMVFTTLLNLLMEFYKSVHVNQMTVLTSEMFF